MRVQKDGDSAVFRIPLRQKSYDAIGEECGDVDNLVGIVAGDEFTISQSIDMTYKGKDAQEGMPLVCFTSEDELRKACATLDLDIWVLPVCRKCKTVLRGSHCWDDGPACEKCV